MATTGLIVDIVGTGPPVASPRSIMLRADMDALRMTELNNDLPYRSASPGLAHMCGHDGHMAALIGTGVLLNSDAVRAKVPSNCKIRLLFQPAEETPGGAVPMIEAGCLEGIDEVYDESACEASAKTRRVFGLPTAGHSSVRKAESACERNDAPFRLGPFTVKHERSER
jgi:metal-dependent amidase/aminoacylase/carboxypeptidase family protein